MVFSDAFLPGASELSIKTDIAQMMAATPDSVVFLTNNNTYTASGWCLARRCSARCLVRTRCAG